MSANQTNGSELQQQNANVSVLCVVCCEFYGTAATENMCSKCHRECKNQTSDPSPQMVASVFKGEESASVLHSASSNVLPALSENKEVVEVTSTTLPVIEENKMEIDEKKVQKNKSRCWKCNKKIGLTGFKCKCEYLFCGSHRHAEDHDCEFDHKGLHKQKLSEQNPTVIAAKLERI
eukprot:CAMPEP_0114993860 /NCGR_PEP_ID=MMETSP0216-20121206/12783_1 /TAXON_ID=223996 /ORGANISM="Protocruzia adherens, Strain Boccale" /LENGTH=176 /DNA_ID=CAMNT_0002357587 /DNA_START=148 /DNA_END=678 /DNA_ORIENTATION=-